MRTFNFAFKLLSVMVLATGPAMAADIYVNAAAAGGGNGSLATPYNNIQAALTQAAAAGADTVRIATGTYIEGIRLTVPTETTVEGSYNTAFTTRTLTPTTTITRDGTTTHNLLLVDGGTAVVLDGLLLENGHTQDGAGDDGRGGGVRSVGGSAVTINNCIFLNCNAPGDTTGNSTAVFADDGAAIHQAGGGATMTITNSVFQDCFAENEGIVRADDGVLIVERCTFFNNDANSSMIRARNTSVDRLEVRNSLFYANDSTSGLIYANAAQQTVIEHNTITSNTLTGTGGDGIIQIENENVAALSIQNNIIANNTSNADPADGEVLTADAGLAGQVITNNLFFGNNLFADIGLGVVLGTNGNIGDDPQFVDAANGDFHILSSSPAQGAGIDLGVTVDIDGEARPNPVASNPDIGADEVPPPPNAARGWTLFD